MKLFSFISLAFAACALLSTNINAAETQKGKSKISTKTAKSAAQVETPKEDDEPEPDVRQQKNFEYKCELGNSLTMYTNPDDDQHMAMRWKKRLYRLTRVETTTGAHRFENRKAGFVWIGIPTKALLLDSRKGLQLANECKPVEPIIAEVENLPGTSIPAK